MKKKVLLASAILASSIGLISCGGGGGGDSAPASTSAPTPPPPAPTDVANVLVLAAKGSTSPGALVGLYEGTIKSDGSVVWSSDLNSADNVLDYYHEFSNQNVLLYDTNSNDFYLYSNKTLTPVAGGSGKANSATYKIYLPNFVILDNGKDIQGIVTQNGKYIDLSTTTTKEHLIYAGENYIVYGDGATNENVYVVDKNGNGAKEPVITITNGKAKLLDRYGDTILLAHDSTTDKNDIYVIDDNGNVLKITNSGNASTGDDPMDNIVAGKIVKTSTGTYVAVADNNNNIIEYFKIVSSGASSVVFTPTQPLSGDSTVTAGSFALDGNGHLYLISDCDTTANEYELLEGFIDSNNIFNSSCKNTAANDDLKGYVMLSFSNGILMSKYDSANNIYTDFFHYIYGSSQPTNVALNPNVINAVSTCNNINNTTQITTETDPVYTKTITETIVGKGTDKLMCASSTISDNFAWVEYKGSGLYDGNLITDVNGDKTDNTSGISHLVATQNSMIFVNTANPTKTFYECQFGQTQCSARSLTQDAFNNVYGSSGNFMNVKIKSDTNVLSDGAGYVGFVPNIKAAYFTTTVSTPYTANIQTGAVDSTTLAVPFLSAPARGGNISLSLDKVANVYSPVNAQCPYPYYDYVLYKDANYKDGIKINRPDKTCLINVLQVR
ncbi:MAG TPA: hypothetical protein ENO34_01335 [Sulfurihydrogenibium azorense]|uniref:Lipoprotein n=1 Tax=Sulfurihydrogenibium azorense TaxID=309806 RepID=A0A831YD21_9AQUI|nr:hypothetical protein [Sulfurihydrogenibium azorense]